MSISSAFLAADKLRLDIEHRLIQLDERATAVTNAGASSSSFPGASSSHSSASPDAVAAAKAALLDELSQLETQCFAQISDLQRMVREVEALVEKEVAHRRDMWRERVKQLTDRAFQFKNEASKHMARLARERTEHQRRFLMAGRSGGQRDNLIQAYAKEESSLRSSIRAVDDMEQIGGLVMRSMSKQSEHIKNAQSKLMNVFSYLGMSNSLIRTITRREWVDRIIFWVGVVVTMIVLITLYIYYIR